MAIRIAHETTKSGLRRMLERMRQAARSTMAMPFRAVDVAKQAKAYRLEARGAEDGAANRPEPSSDTFALSEQEIVTAIYAERERCLIDLTSHLRAERDGLEQLQTAMDIAGMQQAAGEAISGFDTIKASHAGAVERGKRAAASALLEYNAFRQRNRISRDARQPTNRTLSGVIMAFLIVVEGAFNATFFASGSDLGLLGGVVLAAAFSAVNVGVAALNGWFPLRWAHHRNFGIKLAGLVAFPSLLVGSLALNAFVAHYRDLAATAADLQPLQAAYAGLLHDPFGLQSIESWFLLALGLLCAGYAIAKGFALDDPYPGYGAHDRRRRVSTEAYEEARLDMLELASEVRDEFTAALREKIESLRGASSQRQHLLASRARNLAEFQAHEGHLVLAAQQLLSIYRKANEATRTAPPPAHFGHPFTFSDHGLDRPAMRYLLEDHGLEVDAQGLIQELEDLRRAVFDRYGEIARAFEGAAE
jgi:ABC-type multidrug transport system fused ATPase/permease subunit